MKLSKRVYIHSLEPAKLKATCDQCGKTGSLYAEFERVVLTQVHLEVPRTGFKCKRCGYVAVMPAVNGIMTL